MSRCTHEGCEREAEPAVEWCYKHGIMCVWCHTSFAKRTDYPYACPGCGVTLTEPHADYWETWAQIAVRKNLPIPEGRKPDDFVNKGATARFTRGLKTASNYIGWLNSYREIGVSDNDDNKLNLEHVAVTVGVLLEAFDLRVREADQRDTWYSVAKRLLSENQKLVEENTVLRRDANDLMAERDASQRLLDSMTKTVVEPPGDDPDPAF